MLVVPQAISTINNTKILGATQRNNHRLELQQFRELDEVFPLSSTHQLRLQQASMVPPQITGTHSLPTGKLSQIGAVAPTILAGIVSAIISRIRAGRQR